MSGGSYDYLCFADESDVLRRLESLQRMADRLDEVCPEAAAETRALFDGPKSLRAEVEARLKRLTDLWYAVEWRDSGDWGDTQLADAVEKFRAQGPAPDALVTETDRSVAMARLVDQAGCLLAEAQRIGHRLWMLPPLTDREA